jgi:hypothetical protein
MKWYKFIEQPCFLNFWYLVWLVVFSLIYYKCSHRKHPYFGWITISKIGQSKFVQSFYVWLIIVPIIAKFFVEIPITEDYIILELPFSWIIFYFSALAFVIGNILYLRCPEIIKEYSSYRDFVSTGRGEEEIEKYLKNLIYKRKEWKEIVISCHYIIHKKKG